MLFKHENLRSTFFAAVFCCSAILGFLAFHFLFPPHHWNPQVLKHPYLEVSSGIEKAPVIFPNFFGILYFEFGTFTYDLTDFMVFCNIDFGNLIKDLLFQVSDRTARGMPRSSKFELMIWNDSSLSIDF